MYTVHKQTQMHKDVNLNIEVLISNRQQQDSTDSKFPVSLCLNVGQAWKRDMPTSLEEIQNEDTVELERKVQRLFKLIHKIWKI